jgi:hypothetical protein
MFMNYLHVKFHSNVTIFPRQGVVAGCCERGKKLPGPMKYGQVTDQQNNITFSKKHCFTAFCLLVFCTPLTMPIACVCYA